MAGARKILSIPEPVVPRSSVPVILGPTGSGKSALALRWAQPRGATLLSADSRQFYRGLDIGTAKPSNEERAAVPHAYLDVLDPAEAWSAPAFAADAWAFLETHAQPVIVAGGSTLHLDALVHGVSPTPVVPAEVRASLEARLAGDGLDALARQLASLDPEEARRVDLANPRRVIRALEVLLHTGQPLRAFHGARTPPPVTFAVVYLRPDRDWLYARLDARVDAMRAEGLVEEVERLLARGVPPEAPGLNTIGYREITGALRGASTLEEAIAVLKRNTRRYAKRQITYFDKHFPEAFTVDPARTALDDAAIDRWIARG